MKRSLALWMLIAAFVLVFGYFGIDKFLNPLLWTGFLPVWMNGLLNQPLNVWIKVIGAMEIGLAVLLLIPHWRVRQVAGILIALHLVSVLAQVGWNDIGARDLALLLASIAMVCLIENPADRKMAS